MPNVKGKKSKQGYITVIDEEGENYRDIAACMCELGFPMNHSSARNHVVRVLKKFVTSVSSAWNLELDDRKVEKIAKDPQFQHAVAQLLQVIEVRRRRRVV